MVKLNDTRDLSNSFLPSEQDAEDVRILENSDLKFENDDASVRDKLLKNLTIAFVSNKSNYLSNYSQCGLDLESLGTSGSGATLGSRNNTRVWPWLAALFYKEGSVPGKNLKCGGSIINKHFVLTAATCVMRFPDKFWKSSDVVVKLGLVNPRGARLTQEIQVRTIYIHPEFNAKNYDYDVAILEMERPIEYNLYVRPICLPPKEIPKNNFYKPKSTALALGWGPDEKKPRTNSANRDNVKEVDLIIQHPDICKDSLRSRNMEARYTDRMFCAAEVKHYTCFGDGGGPAMQSRLSEDGYLVWTQVGIVSWGVGCGLKNEYAFYSHVQKFMPWINAITEGTPKGQNE